MLKQYLIFKNNFDWIENVKVEYFDSINEKPAFIIIYNTTNKKIGSILRTDKKLSVQHEINSNGSFSILQDEIDEYIIPEMIDLENIDTTIMGLQNASNLDIVFRHVISITVNS